MEYRTLGRTGLAVSVLGFGALEIGRNWPYWRQDKEDFSRPTESDAIKVLYTALDNGINFFDTAPAYFQSEEILGKAFKGMRKEVLLATKCGEWFDGTNSVYDYSYSETKKFIDNSLRLLQTDYIDLLQIHSAEAEILRKGETLRAMKEAQQSGKVRYLGLSTDFVDAATLGIESGEYDSIQVSYNAINLLFAREVFPRAKEKQIGVIIKDGMARGKLSPKFADVATPEERKQIEILKSLADKHAMSLSELALRFVISNPIVSSVIIGTKKQEHLNSNIVSVKQRELPSELVHAIGELNT
ncbi:MAG: aldo/keto reductase [Ignavibacteriales bacterium]|nr:aldo/keto reductase [Ignavibacteriales bacterium]